VCKRRGVRCGVRLAARRLVTSSWLLDDRGRT
jgi:hypothetical protein